MNARKVMSGLWFCLLMSATVAVFAQMDALEMQFGKDVYLRHQIGEDYRKVVPIFEAAYEEFPSVPRGVLEAVAFQYTRFAPNLDDFLPEADAMPRTYSVMGLMWDGKGVFRENLRKISQLSNISDSVLAADNREAVRGYAAAFSVLQKRYGTFRPEVEAYKPILIELSELPFFPDLPDDHSLNYPMQSSLYAIYTFLADSAYRMFGAPARQIDFDALFGESLPRLRQREVSVSAKDGQSDSPEALWCAAASCNFSSGRHGLSPSNVVVHYTSGTYAGAIAWFQNCAAQASAHYVIRSVDGQITQMVREADKAWHVGSANGYTIGIEHEAYGNVASFFTDAMYASSAALVRNICDRNALIKPHRLFYRDTLDDGTVLNYGQCSLGGADACTQIRGHHHYPGQTHTDPGPYWDWNYYYKLINRGTPVDTVTATSGVFLDSGGETGDYGNDERKLFLIHIPGADSVVLQFEDFSLEPDYDFMWIYQGDSEFSPLLGRWNTQSPGRVVANGESMFIEFRSDCGDTDRGWRATWHGFLPLNPLVDETPPQTEILFDEDQWITHDVTINFRDTDDVGVKYAFYQIMERRDNVWSANPAMGFLCDNFDRELNADTWITNPQWEVAEHALRYADTTARGLVCARLNGNCHDAYLYDFYLSMDAGNQCSFYLNGDIPSSSVGMLRNGYEVRFSKSEHSVTLFRWRQGVATQVARSLRVYFTQGQSYLYRVLFDRTRDSIAVFRHQALLLSGRDTTVGAAGVGECIAFATEHSAVTVDNLRVYGSRTPQVRLFVGESDHCQLRMQADQGTPTCRLKSIVVDGAGRFSSMAEKALKVDYSPPAPPARVTAIYKATTLQGDTGLVTLNWEPSSDDHSDIKMYQYALCVESSSAGRERLQWNDASQAPPLRCGIRLTASQRFRVAVRAMNKAGIYSPASYSTWTTYSPIVTPSRCRLQLAPNPVMDYLSVTLYDEREDDAEMFRESACWECCFYDQTGRRLGVRPCDASGRVDVAWLRKGTYIVEVLENGKAHAFATFIKR